MEKQGYEASFSKLLETMNKEEFKAVEKTLQWMADHAEIYTLRTITLYVFKCFDIWAKQTKA